MNKEVKEKWVAALTSGEYKQGVGQLKTPDNRYCCLGVLTELYRKETGIGEWDGNEFCGTSEPSCSFLTDEVTKWAELPSGCPWVGNYEYLQTMNDVGISFAEIARRIDEGL